METELKIIGPDPLLYLKDKISKEIESSMRQREWERENVLPRANEFMLELFAMDTDKDTISAKVNVLKDLRRNHVYEMPAMSFQHVREESTIRHEHKELPRVEVSGDEIMRKAIEALRADMESKEWKRKAIEVSRGE